MVGLAIDVYKASHLTRISKKENANVAFGKTPGDRGWYTNLKSHFLIRIKSFWRGLTWEFGLTNNQN